VSRLFDGSGDWLDYAGALVSGQPLTLACFFKRTSVGNDRLVTIGVNGTDENYNSIWLSSAGAVLAVSATTTATSAASTLVLASTDLDWHSGMAVFAATNDRRAYLDGANKGTSINTRAPAGQNTTRLGASLASAAGFNGYLARVAIWSAALDDAEAVSFHAGLSPSLIRPGSLVEWWELPSGGSLTGSKGTVLTATNTTASADIPAILNSSAPAIQAATFRAPIVGGKRRTGGVSQTDTTAPSPAPILVTPTAISQTTIDLAWSPSFDAQSGLRRYNIERSSVSGVAGFAAITSVAPEFIVYKDSGLVPNTPYWFRVKAEDNAGNISTSNVVTATTSPTSGGTTSKKIWEYTGSYSLSGFQNYQTTSVTNALAKRMFNIISMYPLWEANKTPKAPAMVQAVKAASTIGTEMYPYIIYQSIQKVHATDGNANNEAYRKMATNKWWAYTNGLTETGEVDDAVNTFKKMNYTDTCKEVGGQIQRDWYIEWSFGFLRDGATVSNGLTSYTHLPNPYWDGIFIDNVFWRERSPNADFDRSGTAESVTTPAAYDLIQRAHAAAADKIRAMAPTYKVMCNSADWQEAVASNPGKTFAQVCPTLDQRFDGGVIELAVGKTESYEAKQNFARLMAVIKTQMDAYRSAKMGLIEMELPTWTQTSFSDYKFMRYGLGIALVTGAYIYHHGPKYKSEDLPFLNFDEYELDIGLPIEPAQYTPRAQAGSNGEGIIWRLFERGLVVVTTRRGSGDVTTITQTAFSTLTLPAGGPWYPPRASSWGNQDPIANPGGAAVTQWINPPARDCRIYMKTPQ